MSHSMLTNGRPQSLRSSQKFGKGGLNSSAMGVSTKNSTSNGLRTSTGNLSAALSTPGTKRYNSSKSTSDLERIEAEYIKNLQQQVYFLELETNYLREQARKSAELQPQMSAEAKRMIDKLRELQGELDASKLDMKHKQSDNEVIKIEHERVVTKLKTAEDVHQQEKHVLLDEIVSLKKGKELLDRTLVNKESQLIDIQQDLEKAESVCRSSENKHRLIESQLNQKDEQLKLLQKTLDDKRVDLLKAEEKLRKTTDQFYASANLVNDRVKEDLREEIQLLKQKMKEMETSASLERQRRLKMTDESGQLTKENAILNQRIQDLKTQLQLFEKERSQQNESTGGGYHSASSIESKKLKDQRSHYHLELEQTKEQLKLEQHRVKQLMEQIEEQDRRSREQPSLTEVALQTHVAETSARNESKETENHRLRIDKEMLIERVGFIQNELEEKQTIIRTLEEQIRTLQNKLRALEQLQEFQSFIHSQKWEEFARLADSMKTLSRSVMQTTATANQKPRNKPSDLNNYS